MLKYCGKEEKLLLGMLDFYVKTRISFSLRDKRLFEIIEVEITRIDCTYFTGTSDVIKRSFLSVSLCAITRFEPIVRDLFSPEKTRISLSFAWRLDRCK